MSVNRTVKGLLGKKLGMTQVWDENNKLVPVTVVEAGSNVVTQIKNAARPADRAKLLGDAQRLLANDAVHAFLYSNQWITVANKNLKGLWKDMPVFVNDISSLSWS